MASNNDLGDLFGSLFGIPGLGGHGPSSEGPGTIPVDAEVVDDEGNPARGGSSGGGRRGGGNPFGGGGSDLLGRIAVWSKRALIVCAVVLVVLLAVCYWWFHPAINLHSTSVWSWVLLICVIVMGALGVASIRHTSKAGVLRKLIAIPGAVIVAFFLGILLGQPFIPGNAERYSNVLQTTDANFSEDIHEVDYSEVPVIDRDSAVLLGNRAMGSIPEYVSQFEISDAYSQINYKGHPVRVSPLVYADLFKWLSNRSEGIPAYVLVDMVTQDAKVVKLDQPIKYSESEPLARNIDRYAQLKYPTYMFDQKSFELDDEGTPWWVFPVQKRTIGLFDGTTIQRVVLVNACTGETQDYDVKDCPEWVDRAYPSDLIVKQYNWSGAYKNGWLNSWIGQQGVVRVTTGTNGQLGYNYLSQGQDIYLYAGVTSVTADNSNVGFIMVNQRTGESHYYAVAGATEDSAMASAEGQVQNLKYHATYPLLINISGQPTYFMSLKDDAGLVKMYAMINVEQYQTVATGNTVAQAQDNYLKMLADGGILTGDDAKKASNEQQAKGKVATIAQAVIDGNSHFYVTLEGDDGIYDFALPDMIDIVTKKVGDELEFSWSAEDGASTRKVTKFGGESASSSGGDSQPAATTTAPAATTEAAAAA